MKLVVICVVYRISISSLQQVANLTKYDKIETIKSALK